MRSDDIIRQRFQTTRFTRGYEPSEVDSFLERAVEALRSHEGGLATAQQAFDASAVEEARFSETMMRQGYDQSEVDAFLDRLAEALRARADAARAN